MAAKTPRNWSQAARQRAAEKGQNDNLKQGTPAAKQSPIAGPFETNQEAKGWTIRSPGGVTYSFRNLRLFVRDNPELFPGNTVDRVAHGFYAIKRGFLGKRTVVHQYKGWTLLGWQD